MAQLRATVTKMMVEATSEEDLNQNLMSYTAPLLLCPPTEQIPAGLGPADKQEKKSIGDLKWQHKYNIILYLQASHKIL